MLIESVIIKDNKLPFKLEDGVYDIFLKSINEEKTLEDFRRQYFAMIDECCLYTGNDKQTIHQLIKTYGKISSTKELATNSSWRKYIDNFKWYALQEMDIVL